MYDYLENIIHNFEFLDIKKYREILCENYIEENFLLAPLIIKYWNLYRVENKYINKSRNYLENSYSKKKIKEEEIILINKILLFLKFRFYVEEQKKFTDKFLELTNVEVTKDKDIYMYRYLMLSENKTNPIKLIVLEKNDQVRLDVFSQLISLWDVRNKIIKKHLEFNKELSLKVIELYKLGRIHDKYVTKLRDFRENYYVKTKIKEEEIKFIVKMFLFGMWNNRIKEYCNFENEISSLNPNMYKGDAKKKNHEFLNEMAQIYIEDFYNDNIIY